MKRFLFLLALAATPLGAWTPSEKLTMARILPTAEESQWLEIPWRTDLWEARREADRQDKLIYLWEMDGHPLGCT